MTIDENTTRNRIQNTLQAFEKRDAVAAASTYVEDGVFIDPHYPESEYRGRETIREAFEWALSNLMGQPEFIVQTVVGEDDTYAVEVDTHYITKEGSERAFSEVFIVEGSAEGITRWQTYLPFPPSP